MPGSSLDLLEFPALRRLLGRYLAGPLGRAELDRIGALTSTSRRG